MNEYTLLKQAVMMKLAEEFKEGTFAKMDTGKVHGKMKSGVGSSTNIERGRNVRKANKLRYLKQMREIEHGPGRGEMLKGRASQSAPNKTMQKVRRAISSGRAHGKASWKLGKGKLAAGIAGAGALGAAGYGAYRYGKSK